jgi:hypothetical protein
MALATSAFVFQSSLTRIANTARPSRRPVFPNIWLNALLAFLFSLLLAAGVAVIADIPRRVPMITLDEECATRSLQGPYLVKVDTQGFELEVLRGASAVLEQTEVLILEVSFFRLFTSNPIFSEVVAFMADRGFEFYDLLGSSTRPLDGALAQADVVFARRDGMLRRQERFA